MLLLFQPALDAMGLLLKVQSSLGLEAESPVQDMTRTLTVSLDLLLRSLSELSGHNVGGARRQEVPLDLPPAAPLQAEACVRLRKPEPLDAASEIGQLAPNLVFRPSFAERLSLL